MPSTRQKVAYRPHGTEEGLLDRLQEETGLPEARSIGLAVCELAKARGLADDFASSLIVRGRPEKEPLEL